MWIQMVTDAVREQYEVRECVVCTYLIANDLNYGRRANAYDSNICEVCEVRPYDLDADEVEAYPTNVLVK